MAKAKKSPVKKEGPQVRPSLMFHDGELFIEYTFKREAREHYGLTPDLSDGVFSQCLQAGLIKADRIVYPGIQSYTTGPNIGSVSIAQANTVRKKV
jgi:hypothetical protein